MDKFAKSIGLFVITLFILGSCFGAGRGQHLRRGSLANPLELGWGIGVEAPRVSDNIRRVYLEGMFDVGDGGSDQGGSGASFSEGGSGGGQVEGGGGIDSYDDYDNRSAAPSAPSSGLSTDPLPWQRGGSLRPCAGDYDINCDGEVNQADADLAQQFQNNTLQN